MKKVVLYMLASGIVTATFAQNIDRSVRPQPGPAPEIKLADPQSFTLPNGLKVFVVENHKLPRVAVSVQFDIDPALQGDKAGYVDMIGDLMSSGTKTRTKDQFNKEVDMIGAKVATSKEGAYAMALTRNQDKLMELMSDMLLNADFKQEELDKIKVQTMSGLASSKEEPNAIAVNVVNIANYGKNHPYGEITTETTVGKITLADCKNYYNTYFKPNVAYMAIVGDITLEDAKKLVEKNFGKWAKGNVPVAQYPAAKAPAKTRVITVNKTGAVQSVVNVTYPVDLKIGTPDVVKTKVLNTILGGGASGRLFQNLREAHGWTYGSYSQLNADELVGEFAATAECRNLVTDSAVAEIIAEMNKLRNDKVADQDLQNTKNFMGGKFAMSLEDPQTVANFAINIERYKMPKDYYKNYLKNLSAVSSADIQTTAQKYLTPQNANIVVVGSVDEVAAKLKRFSPDQKVEILDNYGNPAEAKKAAPANISGSNVIEKYVKATGGEKAWRDIKDLAVDYDMEVPGATLKVTQINKAPNMSLTEVKYNGMTFSKEVCDGKTAKATMQGQTQEFSGKELEDKKTEANLLLELDYTKLGYKMDVTGQEKINGKDAYVVAVTAPGGDKTTEYFDVESGLKVKSLKSQETPQGNVSFEITYDKYTDVGNGYKIPYVIEISGAGQKMSRKVTKVDLNKGVKDDMFKL